MEESKFRQTNQDIFMRASQTGDLQTIKKMLGSGLDINARDRHSNTALFYCRSLQTARFLLSVGANLNYANNKSETPLHAASQKGIKEMVLFLILNGADVSVMNVDGHKAEDLNGSLKPYIYAIDKDKQAYNSLNEVQRKKLLAIFQQIDADQAGFWNLEKSSAFNRYMENVDSSTARKDAQDFLREVSICEQGHVNSEEWLFSFGKLAAEQGNGAVDSFLEEYEGNVRSKGKFEDYSP